MKKTAECYQKENLEIISLTEVSDAIARKCNIETQKLSLDLAIKKLLVIRTLANSTPDGSGLSGS